MNNSILIHIIDSDPFIAVSTYDRRHGRHGRFLIFKDTVQKVLNTNALQVESDLSSYCRMCRDGNNVSFRFTWLSEHSGGAVSGFNQSLKVPAWILNEVLTTGKPWRFLHRDSHAQAKIDTTHIRVSDAAPTKRLRRALSKALRDRFQWQGETVTLYPDWDGFYFRASSGLNGGLIKHESTRKTRNGAYREARFEIHT